MTPLRLPVLHATSVQPLTGNSVSAFDTPPPGKYRVLNASVSTPATARAPLDASSPKIHSEIVHLIVQWLNEQHYAVSAVTLSDEAETMSQRAISDSVRRKRLSKAILNGDWTVAERAVNKLTANKERAQQDERTLLYLLYTQQYLEMIDRGDYQSAFTFLHRKLKALEAAAHAPRHFSDLCYLLTCKSVTEAESFRDWQSVTASRQALADRVMRLAEFATTNNTLATANAQPPIIPPNRLVTLLQQAVLYQIQHADQTTQSSQVSSAISQHNTTSVDTILSDYTIDRHPSQLHLHATLRAHEGHVKCVSFVGANGDLFVSGGNDCSLKIWSGDRRSAVVNLTGHSARVWSVDSNTSGDVVISGSADGTLGVWKLTSTASALQYHYSLHRQSDRDVYGVAMHPMNTHCATAGDDGAVHFIDLTNAQTIHTINEHADTANAVAFSPYGHVMYSASSDKLVHMIDLLSGAVITTLNAHLAAVSSVAVSPDGLYVATSAMDNTIRVWDVRQQRIPIRNIDSAHNSWRRWIRTQWTCATDSAHQLLSGGEDGALHIWNVDESGDEGHELTAHTGTVYDVAYNKQRSMIVSAGQDETVRVWAYQNKLTNSGANIITDTFQYEHTHPTQWDTSNTSSLL